MWRAKGSPGEKKVRRVISKNKFKKG
jgi:hypothetical protein